MKMDDYAGQAMMKLTSGRDWEGSVEEVLAGFRDVEAPYLIFDAVCKFLVETFSTDLANWLLGEPVALSELSPSELSLELRKSICRMLPPYIGISFPANF